MKKIEIILIIFLNLFLISCASQKEEVKSVVTSYNKALEALKNKNYSEAAEKFEAIYDDYPLSNLSLKAGNMAAYAYYKDEKYEDVIRIADTFIGYNPTGKDVPYLQYMKSISYFNMMPNVNRGQDDSENASSSFRELVARFPTSDYAKDARTKIAIIDNHLAAAKMNIGRYQMKNQNYIGAILQFSNVAERYSHTNQAPEAYFRLYEIYYKLGIEDKAVVFKTALEKLSDDNIWKNEFY